MNYKVFTEAFLLQFIRNNKDVEIEKYWHKEKSLIRNFPYKNINIEIKPNNTGLFVIQLMNFEFFDYDLLVNYWRKKLIHKDANFILNSKCIYIYPRQRENLELCVNVLNFATETILNTIFQIESLLIFQ